MDKNQLTERDICTKHISPPIKNASWDIHNMPLATIEVKEDTSPVAVGMQQDLFYTDLLEVPFIFSSSGDGFIFHDRTSLSPQVEQMKKYQQWKGCQLQELEAIAKDYYEEGGGKSPCYYQIRATNKMVEAIAKEEQVVLLVMAIGRKIKQMMTLYDQLKQKFTHSTVMLKN